MNGRPAPRGVLLDIDGTLLDSNDAHARAWVDVLAEAGMPQPFERVRPLIGMGGDKVVPQLTGFDADSERGQAIAARRKEIFNERHLPRVRAFDGSRALVQRLHDEGFRVVVATSAQSEELEGLLRQGGLEDLLPQKTSSSDADASKPEPDILEAALARIGVGPDEAVMIGDTPYDLEAARRCGVAAVAVRCGGWWDDAALAEAAAIYDGPAALLAAFEESPLAGVREDSGGARR